MSKLTRSTTIVVNGNTIEVKYDDLAHEKILGKGQFGTVGLYLHKPTNLRFAVKRIESRNDLNNQIEIEAPKLLTGECPYIIKMYGALLAEGSIWILSECMNTSLDRFYKKAKELNEKLKEDFISHVAFHVLNALAYLKEQKIMHRDVKPSNTLINKNGQIKLCDFGISAFMKSSVCITLEAGTRPYMPPEKLDPRTEKYSVKADIWSLGISLIEIATFVHPYQDVNDYFAQIRVHAGAPPKLNANEFSNEFCLFVERCLVKEPENRASIQELMGATFITTHKDKPVDLQFVSTIIDQIAN